MRGKKGRTTKTGKTEKKVENTCTRVRFSNRSRNQSPSHEKELKSDQVTERSQLGADGQPCTGRKIAVDHPVEKIPLEPTETICNDDYPLHRKPKKNKARKQKDVYRAKKFKPREDCCQSLEIPSKYVSYKENEASKKECNTDIGLSEKELSPSVESLAVVTSVDVIPFEVGISMTTNSSHVEMNAFAEVHSEIFSISVLKNNSAMCYGCIPQFWWYRY